MPNLTIENGREAFQLHQQLITLKKSIGLQFLNVGRVLWSLREGERWRAIEPDISWEGYCLSPDVSISPSHARNLIRVYRKFVVELGLPEEALCDIDPRKLTAIIPRISKENGEMMLERARSLSRMDLTQTLKEDGLPEDHVHDWQEVSYRRCKICYERETF